MNKNIKLPTEIASPLIVLLGFVMITVFYNFIYALVFLVGMSVVMGVKDE